jgi:putative membrane protein insertion efficiency factor
MGGGSCARDACLLESGCCLAESLGGNCLVLAVALSGRLLVTLVTPRSARSYSPAELLLAAIARYRSEISSHRPVPCCRFTPSCSEYADEAVRRHGALRGGWLAIRRLLRCRPGGRRGHDPVPA